MRSSRVMLPADIIYALNVHGYVSVDNPVAVGYPHYVLPCHGEVYGYDWFEYTDREWEALSRERPF